MNKSSKLFLVPLIFIIIIGVWFFGIKKYRFFNVKSMQEDTNYLKTSFLNAWNSDGIPNLTSISDIKNAIKNQVREQDSKSKVEQLVQDKLKQELVNNKTEYGYEPWGVKIMYLNDVTKTFDDKTQKIFFRYDDKNFLEINRDIFKEKKFDDWLIKHFDLKELTKENLNDLVFWSYEKSANDVLDKNYYVNIDKNIYYLTYHCIANSSYCNKLEEIAKSFSKIK